MRAPAADITRAKTDYAGKWKLRKKSRGATATLCKRSFARYCREAWSEIEGAKPLEWTPFHEGFCNELQALAEGWFAARGVATERQLERVYAHWQRHGLFYEEGEVLVQNEIFNLAPGTLKSTIMMVLFPSWVWLHYPAAMFACTSGVDENVNRDSDKCRELVQSRWYRETFQITWRIKGKGATTKWRTTAAGSRISRKFLGGWSGVHVDFFLVDDPIDALRVWNKPARDEVNSKFTKAIENRVNDPDYSVRIVGAQRTHVEDLPGYLRNIKRWTPEDRKGWAIFIVPMRFGFGPKAAANENQAIYESPFGWKDPRTVEGEVMQPSRFTSSFIVDELRNKGTAGFAAQLDQNPESGDGGWFLRRLWRFFRVEGGESDWLAQIGVGARPRPDGIGTDGMCSREEAFVLERNRKGGLKLDWMLITIDATFGSKDTKTASNVGFGVCGGQGLRKFVLDDRTQMMNFPQTIEMIRKTVILWDVRRVLIEVKANGQAIIDELRKEVANGKVIGRDGKKTVVVIDEFNPGRDTKEGRARAMLPDIEAGLWYVLDGAAWLQDFFNEVCAFPNGKRDDRVDMLSQVSAKYSSHNEPMRRAMAMARK